jgi:2-(1,2-epoxy-1,2-dihydrophenyl)acetyl-CoA isomerase
MDRVVLEQTDNVATLRLNDPAAMNAMSGEMAEAMTALLAEAGKSARAIVLAGHAKAFCAGANLAGGGPAGGDAGARLESSFNPLMVAIKACPVPIISAVRGAAAGIGASVALACDMIVAGESAYFLQAFRRVGLVPDGGAALLLAHTVGRVRAMELMLLGERLPAPRALEWGLINRVVADESVEDAAAVLAAELAAGPTVALGLMRRAGWAALSQGWEAQLALERGLQKVAGATADCKEGVAAFLGKRAATFEGR